MRRSAPLALLLALLVAPSLVSAQSGRTAFEVGLEHAQHERWEEADDAFRRAYLQSHNPAALYNRGLAQLELGRPDDAVQTLTRLADDEAAPEALRAAARAAVGGAEARRSELRVDGLPPAVHTIEVDGHARVDDLRRPLVLDVPAGLHRVRVSVADGLALRWTGHTRPGQARAIALEPVRPRRFHNETLAWILSGVATAATILVVAGIAFIASELSAPPPSGATMIRF